MVSRSPVAVSPVSNPPNVTLPNGGSNGSQLSVPASLTAGRPSLPTTSTMPSIYSTGSAVPPLPRMHPKRKPLPPTVDVNTLSTLTSGRFPGGGPSSPIRHTQAFSATGAAASQASGQLAQGQPPTQSAFQYLNKASPSVAQSPYIAQQRPLAMANHRDTLSTDNVVPAQVLRRRSQENRDGRRVPHDTIAMLASSPSLPPPPGGLINSESPSTKTLSRSSTESSGSSLALSVQESPTAPLQIRRAAFQTHSQQGGSNASIVSSNSVSTIASVADNSGTSSASLEISRASAFSDQVSLTQHSLGHTSQFSEHTISSTDTSSQLKDTSTSNTPVGVASPSDPSMISKKADYVKHLRRQRATVWSDRMQRDILTKQRQSHHHKEKEKTKKPREDEYSTYTHAYAYYHPKLDMTLELNDARVMSDTRSMTLASHASGITLGGETGTKAEKPEDKAVEAVPEYSVTELPTEQVPALGDLNLGMSMAGNEDPQLASSRGSVSSSEKTVVSHASLQIATSADGIATNKTPNAPMTANILESSATDLPGEEMSRRLSVGSLDEQAIAPRRTLYIVNPDYSSSDGE
ncbi:hypothetical protein V1517DRAFT_74257 [Lipomyces orientalis]|uniref:Uncharacterized protein n=1 Tax=Lipomyces orientalis TaxID=1233043 RepID=A0ACC3TSD7_9ASCO